jgi:hypothetical protein
MATPPSAPTPLPTPALTPKALPALVGRAPVLTRASELSVAATRINPAANGARITAVVVRIFGITSPGLLDQPAHFDEWP